MNQKLRALLALTLLSACTMPPANSGTGGGGSEVQLSVDRATYRTGDPIVLTLTNRSAQPIGYNLCSAALERRVGSDWQATNQSLAEVCTMELRTLAPNASDTYRHTLPAGVTAGEYRVRTNAETPLGGSMNGVASNAFRVN